VKPYTCKYCKKCYSQLGNCKRHERTHTGKKPYTCKYCKKCFNHSANWKQHERTHTIENARDSSLKCKQDDQHYQLRRHPQELVTTHGVEKSDMLFSLTEENSSQVESLICWICQEEFSSETYLIQHYDDHMR